MKKTAAQQYIDFIADNLGVKLNDIKASALMAELDSDNIETDQDWKKGETAYLFSDGSKIVVNGPDFDVC